MRRIVFTLAMLAALGAAGCSNHGAGSGSGQQGSAAAQPQATSVTGTISVSGTPAPSKNATLDIKLVDASVESQPPLASKTISPLPSLPVDFTLDFDPKKINRNDLYVVQAKITDGERTYTMPLQAPVLTQGSSNHVAIALVPQKTPAEKMLDAYNHAEQQIGGMKRTQGTKLEKGTSLAWQVFSQDGQVQYIRELIDNGKKGFIANDFAYKNGKPWVVVQKHKADENAKAHEIDRAGWNEQGDLVLRQKIVSGKTETLDAKEAAGLRQQAEAMYKRVAKKK